MVILHLPTNFPSPIIFLALYPRRLFSLYNLSSNFHLSPASRKYWQEINRWEMRKSISPCSVFASLPGLWQQLCLSHLWPPPHFWLFRDSRDAKSSPRWWLSSPPDSLFLYPMIFPWTSTSISVINLSTKYLQVDCLGECHFWLEPDRYTRFQKWFNFNSTGRHSQTVFLLWFTLCPK